MTSSYLSSTIFIFDISRKILHWVYRNFLGTKTNSSYRGFRVIEVRVIETRMYIKKSFTCKRILNFERTFDTDLTVTIVNAR